MNDLEVFANKLKSYTVERQEADLAAIVKSHEAEIVDINLEQLMAGQNSDGSPIMPEYTDRTVEIKKAKGQPSDRVTLKDEGDFHNSFFLEGEQFPFTTFATDIKLPELTEKYGDAIFGFTEESKARISNDVLKEDITEYYKNIVKL
jgi:hypothetical protein